MTAPCDDTRDESRAGEGDPWGGHSDAPPGSPGRTAFVRWAAGVLVVAIVYVVSPVPATWLLMQVARHASPEVFDTALAVWLAVYRPLIFLSSRLAPVEAFYEACFELFDIGLPLP